MRVHFRWAAEFLQMLTAEANEKAKAEGKNTINEAHTLFALQKLGFGHYESNLPVTGATAEVRPSYVHAYMHTCVHAYRLC